MSKGERAQKVPAIFGQRIKRAQCDGEPSAGFICSACGRAA